MRRTAGLATAAMVVGSLVTLAPAPASAAGVFTVDVLVDTVDASPGDGVCADAGGDCSLRAAILEANALEVAELPVPDEILLPAGTITLTLAGDGEDAGLTGDLDLWTGVTLRGAGTSSVIDGDGLDRVLDTHHHPWFDWYPGGPVALADLRITGGVATDGLGGGGVRSAALGLTLTNVTVDGNRAEHDDALGGGVYFATSWDNNAATIALVDSTITGNAAIGPGAGGGGVASHGGVQISGGSLTDNRISNDDPGTVGNFPSLGAGLAVLSMADDLDGLLVSIDGASITGNELVVGPGSATLWGGGIGLYGPMRATVASSAITGNVGTVGGGVATWATDRGEVLITGSTISQNTAVGGASPGDGLGGGVAVTHSSSDVVVDRTELSGNAAVIGGGIGASNVLFDLPRAVIVRRSTVSGNTASDHGGGIANHSDLFGWGTGTVPPALEVDSSTISSNVAPTGGGISVGADTTISMEHATVAANTGGGISTGGASTVAPMSGNVVGSQATGADCSVTAGSGLVSGGANADSDDTCGLTEPSDLPGVDPVLGPLADNGGPTFTHLPLAGSPLVDTAGACTGTDQRVVTRPQSSACDIGSVEVEPVQVFSDVAPGHLFFDDIWWVWQAGLLGGYTDGTFRSTAAVSRQALAAVLWRDAGSPTGPFPDPGFSDVHPTHPFYTAIAWAKDAEIINGYADGTFRSTTPMSRQAFVVILWRAAESPTGPFPDPGFSDVAPTHPFYTAIAWAKDAGIVDGYGDGTFRSTEPVSRQALAAILHAAAI